MMLTDSCKGTTVLIPMLVASLAALAAVLVRSRADAHGGVRQRPWRLTADALVGLGIWTTHGSSLLLSAPKAGHDLPRHVLLNALSLLLCLLAALLCLKPARSRTGSWTTIYGRPPALGLGVTAAHLLSLKAAGFQLDITAYEGTVMLVINLLAGFVICGALLHAGRSWMQSRAHEAGMIALLALAMNALHYGSMIPVMTTLQLAPISLHEVLANQWLDALASFVALTALSGALAGATLDARVHRHRSHLVDSLTAANLELNRLAHHDPLTHLPNHSLFEEKLRLAIERARRDASPLIILLIDLDGFKAINKAFGQRQGDQLLIHVAEQIQSVVPQRHSLARIGGDEFVVLLDLESTGEVTRLGGHILSAISMPLQIENHAVSLTASMGIAQYPRDGATPQALIEHATMAMYHAKSGEQAYAFFEPSMNALARDHLLLLNDLRQALPRQQLVLHYQPIMRAPDGPMAAAEVLIRWQHPQHGLLLPEAFIADAERAGLIVDIGNWVIDAACRQLRQWLDRGISHMRLAINVSAIQLHYDRLVETLQTAVARHGVEPSRLTLEFTESVAMKDPERSLAILQRLHRLGFRISLDDFGTGYSSLLYLKQLPATELKIDRSFVTEIDQRAHDRTIVSAIIALARQLQMEIVAEGVETPAQKQWLCDLGCTFLQGYLLGVPVPADLLLAEGHPPAGDAVRTSLNGDAPAWPAPHAATTPGSPDPVPPDHAR